MASTMNQTIHHVYEKLGAGKGNPHASDASPGRTSMASEDDALMGTKLQLPLRPRDKRLRRFLEDPLINFLWGGFMFIVLLTLAIMTITLLKHQNKSIEMAGHGIHNHDQSSDMVALNGLHTTQDGRLVECGDTAEEAKANGCPFDSFAFSYVPPACFEKDLMEEALNADSYLAPWAAGEFPWYMWSNFTDPVPQTAEELSQHKSLWTNNAWHKAHCLYEWRLMARAIHRVAKGVKPVYVLKRALEIAHVNHCNQMVSDPLTHDESPIWAMRSVGRCIRVDQFQDDWEEPELNF